MKKVFIVQEYVPEYRAPFFEMLQQEALRSGIEVRVVAGKPTGEQNARRDAATVPGMIAIKNREFRFFSYRVNLRNSLRHVRSADLVIFEQARRNIDLIVALLFMRSKTALWGHGRDFIQVSTGFRTRLLTLLTNRASWFFGYSKAGVEAVVAGGFDKRRTTVVRNSTDTKALRRMQASNPASYLQELGIEEGSFVGLFVGAFDTSKRLDFLFEALDQITRYVPEFHFVIGGSGPDESLVLEFAKSRPWVHVVGRLRDAALANALASAHVLLMPGRVGLIAVDALAFGLPLATTVWAYHAPEFDYLTAENSVISQNDVESYVNEIVRLATHREVYVAMRENALESGRSLSVEHMVESFVGGLRACLDEN